MKTVRRRHFASLVACCLLPMLAGCNEVSRSAVDTVRLAWRGPPPLHLTAEQVAAKPYYQLQATDGRNEALLILGNVDGQRQLWYGKDGVVVVLAHGRVVQTIGLEQNLDNSRISSAADPFVSGLQTLSAPITYTREDDWSRGYRYGIPVRATLSPTGMADIDILGTSHHVLLITEQLVSEVAGYRAVNRYWVDPQDGFVWKSEQHVLPGLTLTLTQVRPYRGAGS